MPFILIAVAIILLVTAFQGTTGQMVRMLDDDIFGPKGYIYWFVAIFVVGAIGYIKAFKTLSDTFIFLIVLVLILSHRGLFAQFNQALAAIRVPPPAPVPTPSTEVPSIPFFHPPSNVPLPENVTPENAIPFGLDPVTGQPIYIPGM